MKSILPRAPKLMSVALGAILLAGCATQPVVSTSGGQASPSTASTATSGWVATYSDDPAIATAMRDLLSRELDADSAVRLAFLANPALHRKYFDLRVDPAVVAAAATRLGASGPLEVQIATEIAGAAQRSSGEVEALKFEGTRLEMAADLAKAGLDVRRAHIAAVAAGRSVALTADLKTAAEASAELGRRMARVGNWPRLNEFREAVLLGDVSVQVARTRQGAMVARERLTRLLGLSGDQIGYRLPAALGALPSEPPAAQGIDGPVLARRLDLRAQLFDIAAEVRELEFDGYKDGTLSASARFVSLPGAIALSGSAIRPLRVPLYDLGSQSTLAKSAAMMGMITRLSSAVLQAEADLRESETGRRAAYDIAAHHARHMLPLHTRMLDEAVLRYNGMLIGVFDLLTVARARAAAEMAAADALRDYWLAMADSVNALAVGGYASAMPAAAEGGAGGAPAAPH